MIKQFLHKLHLILGLISGIVVFIVSITGALYVFKDEIEGFTQRYRKVSAQTQEMISPSLAFEKGSKALPDKTIHGIVYRTPEDAVEVIYYQSTPFYYGSTYLDPYSGDVIKTVDFLKTFFGFIRQGHATLWLPMKIGYIVVTIGTMIFFILLITGIVLWWPRKNSSSKSFAFTKSHKPTIKRLEYHKVVGFYVFFFALLIVLTGLSWLIKGLDSAMYKSYGGDKDISWNPPLSVSSSKDSVQGNLAPIDVLFKEIKHQYPHMPFIEMHIPTNDSASILVELNRDPSSFRKMDYLYFDQHTIAPIHTNSFYGSYDNASVPDKIRRSYYDIHSGGILGLPGKILAFFVSLFCASLPISGYVLWWKRRKEKKAFLNMVDL